MFMYCCLQIRARFQLSITGICFLYYVSFFVFVAAISLVVFNVDFVQSNNVTKANYFHVSCCCCESNVSNTGNIVKENWSLWNGVRTGVNWFPFIVNAIVSQMCCNSVCHCCSFLSHTHTHTHRDDYTYTIHFGGFVANGNVWCETSKNFRRCFSNEEFWFKAL